MKGKWSAGKIAAVVCGSIAGLVVLTAAFCVDVFRLLGALSPVISGDEIHQQAYGDSGDGFYGYYDEDGSDNDQSEYYEFHDEIASDLSYRVEFESWDAVFGEYENITLEAACPVFYSVEGEELTGVNKAVQKELEELNDYLDSLTIWFEETEELRYEVESYVTYMDEEILSVAFVEYGYIDDEYYESYIVSVNIDMESKMAMTNTQLLEIDDAFSIEFRNRCEKQNGEISSLNYCSDQDITELLTSEESLIIFYTPLGMEVGFNYYYGWVTVTYPDYQQYQRKF